MPTTPCRARHLIKAGEAEVVKRTPFTIRMLIETSEGIQNVTLGVDAGSKHVGLSAVTEKKELFSAEMTLRDDIPQLLKKRQESRRTRRNRLRYRPARFNNRKRPKGWLTPTMENKIKSHVNVIGDICSILPVSKIIVETASFDIQKIKSDDIEGKQYQEGEQLGYSNVKTYVKARDGYACQACGSHEHLEVHHIVQRKDGGSDRPANLVTLCEKCHKNHHNGKKPLDIPFPANKGFRGATEMSTMRWFLLDRLRADHPGIQVIQTYGYITNWNRNQIGLEKNHINDAFCITGNRKAEKTDDIFDIMAVRCHNRQVMKQNITKGGRLKRNQAPKLVKGIARYDVVRYEGGKQMIVTARKTRGLYSLKPLDGSKTLTDVSRGRFTLLWHSNGKIVTRRPAFPTSGQA